MAEGVVAGSSDLKTDRVPVPGAKPPATATDRNDLLVVSFVTLFFELTCIRWVPGYVREMAYYANFILLAAFLGLGVGILLKDRRGTGVRSLFGWATGLALAVFAFKYVQVVSPSAEAFIWENFSRRNFLHLPASLTVLFFFVLTAACFVPIGRTVERCFEPFAPLHAYTLNIAGSVVGVLGFAMLSWLQSPPVVWFSVSFACFVYLARSSRVVGSVMSLMVLALVLALDHSSPGRTTWSPYYKISLLSHRTPAPDDERPGTEFFRLLVDDDFHQRAISMQPGPGDTDYVRSYRERYAFPYAFIRPKSVLVLGAGMGNDAAMALRRGADTVEVVEIDPAIMALGRRFHPDRPYEDPRVVRHVDDARSFLEKSDRQFDLVLFGTLDSHRLFSHMGSVRMDSFVYTVQSIESARELLSERGMLVITFVAHRDWMVDRLYRTVTEAFGTPPLCFEWRDEWVTLVIAKDGRHQEAEVAGGYPVLTERAVEGAALLTDDWPQLYIKSRQIPSEYRGMLAAVLLVAAVAVLFSVPRPRGFSMHFFALGAGFLLLETKSVTEFALLYGSTWVVNAVVFTAILCVILLANLVVARFGFRRIELIYALLALSLLLNYFFELRQLLALSRIGMLAAGSVLIALPIFFAALIFAKTFSGTGNVAVALGSNIVGAVLGGLLEYGSLIVGLKSLYLLAIGVYVISFLCVGRSPFVAGGAGRA